MKFNHPNFHSRRSVVMSRRGMAVSSQPLAVEAAINILRSGGNAIDAAVTATFVLWVVEPMATGLGGDCFSLIYSGNEKRLIGINASGRAPRDITIGKFLEREIREMPLEGPLSITVPGALDGLVQCLDTYGTISLHDALSPAIYHAENGFPVTQMVAKMWESASAKLRRNSESTRVYLPEGRSPRPGELFRNPELAQTLRSIAEGGRTVLYGGPLGEMMVSAVKDLGGLISLLDFREHKSDWVEPIKTRYRTYDVFEMPPNNQGLAALIALNVVEGYQLSKMVHNSSPYLHLLIEAMKAALLEAQSYVGDPAEPIQLEQLLSKEHAAGWRTKIESPEAQDLTDQTVGKVSGDTVYVAIADEKGNVVSMISSLFKAFGSGVTVPDTGVTLQNRGSGFTLQPGHPNSLAPGKRPYHTIMPAMIMKDEEPWAALGVVGGMMQAQGHLQVICNLIDFQMDPQTALDAPRFRVLDDGTLALEDGIPESVRRDLASLGHDIKSVSTEEEFGGGQLIQLSQGTLFGASDPRKDGCAIGY